MADSDLPELDRHDWGASVTIGSDGKLRGIEVDVPGASMTLGPDGRPQGASFDVPGAAGGSDRAEIDFTGGSHDSPHDPGWMPNIPRPDEPTPGSFALDPGPGWHRDPVTGIPVPDSVEPPHDTLRMRDE